jgi:1,2-diacylglycerol 3-beta-galactosyltransferase
MSNTPPERPHILFLFSDTGGGHRSATEAIIEALQLEYGDAFSTEMVDIFLDYAPPPLNQLPALYPKLVRAPRAWGLGYLLSNGHRRARLITGSAWPYVRRAVHRLVSDHPCDLIVSVHPVANAPALKALGPKHPPFITVVTDLVTTHAMWYHTQTDLCVVPTEEAYRRAISCGLKPEQLRVIGLPVADRFCQPVGDRTVLRQRFGWPVDRPLVLLVGGGEGMGPLEQTAISISTACPYASLVVITGRNQHLKAHLEAISWPIPAFIYGFVHEMPDFMRAADVLVTKAGPGTICEALNAGLPMILYSRLPGQEDGNVGYVVAEGAGIWAPTPEKITTALKDWLEQPAKRFRAMSACQRLARPEAARQIAHLIAETIDQRSQKELEQNTPLPYTGKKK